MNLTILAWIIPVILTGIGILALGIWKSSGKLSKFLLLTGSSILGFFIFVLLHNAFYGLGIMTSHIIVLSRIMEALHVIFFFTAIVLCPAGAVTGITGSIVMVIKQRRLRQKNITVNYPAL